MFAERAGRNDPCPCGSGKKYKKCCLERDRQASMGEAPTVTDALREAMEGHGFDSVEALQAFADEFMAQRNQAPVDDFQGLSPAQMSQLLYEPWTSPDLLRFPDPLPVEPDAPVVRLFTLLAEAIGGGGGVKPTAKGNLPRKLCREIALAYFGEDGYREATRCAGINREDDFYELNVTRVLAEMAGLIRKYKGCFILSQECRRSMMGEGMRAIYPRLFKVHVAEFNWAYGDGYAEVPFIQNAFAFTLYMLTRHGETARPASFYEDAFLQAFPAVTREVESVPYLTAEDNIRRGYAIRTLSRFAEFMGLAERKAIRSDKQYPADYTVRKLPLLAHVVKFCFRSDGGAPIKS